jgi:hypothetical protein
MSDPFAIIHPRSPAYQWLRFGEVRPAGWIREQMRRDLENGFLGHLDALVPGLIRDDDIYGSDRLTALSKHKDLGTVATDAAAQTQYMWWNSETQSNWRDGLVRTALLLDHAATLPKVQAYIERILATQDADGYLGIYAPDLRFNFAGENGELWAQATLFRVLLGYYEATGEARVLRAVEAALQATMAAYPQGRSQPFPGGDVVCGDSHGLVITDVLERLSQLTGDVTYARYAAWLYATFSQSQVSQADAQYGHLVDPAYRFREHAAHTYEHLRSLLVALYVTGNPGLETALAGYLAKLERCLTPSGGPIGDESIDGRDADPSETGYEYCSIHELLDSYTHLLQKTGDPRWADRAEWLLFNAGQGARHPEDAAIAYLKTDNSFSMTGPLHPGDLQGEHNPQIRYKYSPVHQDVAVCCVPNAGRILPYYVKAMWLRSADGLVAALYGACDLQAEVNGAAVRITETTDYPFNLEITFSVEAAQPTEFTLSLRKPAWASGFTLAGAESHTESDGLIHVRKTWSTGDQLTLRFETGVEVHRWGADEGYVSYAALLFVLPLKGEARPGRQYSPGFQDWYYALASDTADGLLLPPKPVFTLQRQPFDPAHPWDALALSGNLLNASGEETKSVRLVPFWGSILRRVTFGKLTWTRFAG